MGAYWKSILAFLSLVVTNLLASVTASAGGDVLPHTASGWLAAVLTTVGGTAAVYFKTNKPVA